MVLQCEEEKREAIQTHLECEDSLRNKADEHDRSVKELNKLKSEYEQLQRTLSDHTGLKTTQIEILEAEVHSLMNQLSETRNDLEKQKASSSATKNISPDLKNVKTTEEDKSEPYKKDSPGGSTPTEPAGQSKQGKQPQTNEQNGRQRVRQKKVDDKNDMDEENAQDAATSKQQQNVDVPDVQGEPNLKEQDTDDVDITREVPKDKQRRKKRRGTISMLEEHLGAYEDHHAIDMPEF